MEITIKIPDTTIKICNECGFDADKTKLVVSSFINKIMNDGYGQFNTDFDSFLNDENFEEIIGEYDAETDNQYKIRIESILTIIKKWGSFSVGELEHATNGVCVNEMGSLVAIAETFTADHADIEVYEPDSFSSDSVDSYTMKYEEMDIDALDEILFICEQWEAEQLRDEDRLSN